MLVHQFTEYYARNFPDNPCVTTDGQTTTYGELNVRANLLANGLAAHGIGHGDRIAVLGENSVEHLLVFLAAGKLGAVAVSLNYRLAPAELTFILSDSKARALIVVNESMQDTLDTLREELRGDILIQVCWAGGESSWSEWLSAQSHMQPQVEIHSQDPFLQLYTSGTTGNPKGVVSSHQNVLAECVMNTTLMPTRPAPGSSDLICAPFFHIGGAGSALISLYAGTEIILHRAFDPEAVVRDIEQYPVNGIFMVPAMIMAVLSLPDIEQRDFSNLKQIYYGASPISEIVLEKAMAVFGTDFIQMYGMTETTGTVVNLTAADHTKALAGQPELLQSCGRPSVGANIKVVDEQGQEVPRGEIGELWVNSDTNMLEYYNLPEETEKNLTDGWVHTGDAGYMDKEGYIYLKDRMKDMVVSGGENIYPVEVENALAKHPAIQDVAVIGVPNEKYGEALLAFVVLSSGTSLEPEEMVQFCRDKIAGYKIPRQLQIIDEMPRNPSGKILKKVLRAPYWEGVTRKIG